MPTYTVFAQTGRLNEAQKTRVAAEITRVHNEQTGAQTFFAQVIFQDVPQGNHFVGGAPLAADHVFVHGQIRAGRDAATKRMLLEHMLAPSVLQQPPKRSVPGSTLWICLRRKWLNMVISCPSRVQKPHGLPACQRRTA